MGLKDDVVKEMKRASTRRDVKPERLGKKRERELKPSKYVATEEC